MKNSVRALLLTLTFTTAMAALATIAANAADSDPQNDLANTRQIVVEGKEQNEETSEIAPITNLDQSQDAEQIASNSNQQSAEETEKVDEELFAPQTKADIPKVDMPTIFTQRQQDLFNELGSEQQTALVKNLIKNYGYEALYPTQVARNSFDDNHSNQSTKDDGFQYHDGYQSSYHSNRSAYGCRK